MAPQSPATVSGEWWVTCTAVCGPFGYSSYATVVTTDRSSFESGHAKESFRGPSIVVTVASRRRFGRVASYPPPIWPPPRTPPPHPPPTRPGFASPPPPSPAIPFTALPPHPNT